MSIPPFNQDRNNWEKFCSARLEYVTRLAEIVEQSFLRRDTAHPVFCGCIDWHSSVHPEFRNWIFGKFPTCKNMLEFKCFFSVQLRRS